MKRIKIIAWVYLLLILLSVTFCILIDIGMPNYKTATDSNIKIKVMHEGGFEFFLIIAFGIYSLPTLYRLINIIIDPTIDKNETTLNKTLNYVIFPVLALDILFYVFTH